MFDSCNNIIRKENVSKGRIDTGGAEYIGFVQSPSSRILIPITFDTEVIDPELFPDTWTHDIKLHAKFQNSIVAGGIQYDLRDLNNECGYIVKRRLSTDVLWSFVGYFDSGTLSIDDEVLRGSFIDRSVIPNNDYYYMIIPVLYGNELASILTDDTVFCSTDGISVSDGYKTYYTNLEPKINGITQNMGSTVISTINGKYPYAFKKGSSNYISGSASGLFVPGTEDGNYIFDNTVWKYRNEFREWLCDGGAKIIKYYDGRTFLVSITDSVTDDDSEHPDKNITSFSFTEIGDVTSTSDLIESGILQNY